MTGTPDVINGSGSVPRFALDQGPITEVHAFWLAGMSCDGCSISILGAQHPSVEQLWNGAIPGLPKIILHHPVLSVAVGKEFMKAHKLAKEGKLGAPYVVIYEGSIADERIAAATPAVRRLPTDSPPPQVREGCPGQPPPHNRPDQVVPR